MEKEIKSKIKEDKRLWLENEGEKIQEFDRNNQSKLLFEKIKTVENRVFQPKQLAIKDHQGATLTDPDKIIDRWKEYGEKLFDAPSASNSPLPPPQEDIVAEPPPLRSEVEYALKKLKSNKSPGLDNIPAELIKAGGPSMINAVHKLCCKIWTSTDWPQDWKQQ